MIVKNEGLMRCSSEASLTVCPLASLCYVMCLQVVFFNDWLQWNKPS